MLLESICWAGLGNFTIVNGNINEEKDRTIFDNELWPNVAQHFPQIDFVFQDANAPRHHAKSLLNYKNENNIRGSMWPAQSPNGNIIKKKYWLFKNQLRKRVSIININSTDPEQEIRRIRTTIPIF